MATPGAPEPRRSWLDRRRDRIAEEIARNRRGGHKIPTWVLAATLAGILLAWCGLIMLVA